MCDKSKPLLNVICAAVAAVAILAASEVSYGHGEDKPGPNGGFIRMPGAFHTEVVPKANTVDVYLLDVHWKNPVTNDSKLEVDLVAGKSTERLDCKPEETRFVCKTPKGRALTSGELVVRAERLKAKGAEVRYALPLKYQH